MAGPVAFTRRRRHGLFARAPVLLLLPSYRRPGLRRTSLRALARAPAINVPPAATLASTAPKAAGDALYSPVNCVTCAISPAEILVLADGVMPPVVPSAAGIRQY